jgi:hypothetical protein
MKANRKTVLSLGFALVLLAGAGFSQAGDLRLENPLLYENFRDSVFAPLFAAMQAGDLATIKKYLPADAYEPYRVLFERNKEYGQFLRNYYAGATFELGPVVTAGNDYVADVYISWPSGRTSTVKLRVAGNAGQAPTGTASGPGMAPAAAGSAAYSVAPEPPRRHAP